MNHALAHTQTPTYDTIQEQNDLCRQALTDPSVANLIPCRTMLTHGIMQLPVAERKAIISIIANYSAFGEDNDPYGEQDFGSIDHEGHKIFWKFDYYDQQFQYGSEDPADITKTNRVLTIMLAQEY